MIIRHTGNHEIIFEQAEHISSMTTHDNVVHESASVNSTNMNTSDFRALIAQAQASADFDSKLTVMQALKKHKKAVFWAMILSTSLIMEGYDLVIVRAPTGFQYRSR